MIAVLGQRIEGIHIVEENRATIWEYADKSHELQAYMESNYLTKGVRAILIGVRRENNVSYAVFVEDGFLRPTTAE